MIPGQWPVDDVERVFRAVADYSRRQPDRTEPPRKGSTLPPKERAARIARNKAAREARRRNRGG